MSWTDERIAELRELWAQGYSASQIAKQIGGVTRNAVIGKAHRLGLQGRPSPIRSDGAGGRRSRRRAQFTPQTITATAPLAETAIAAPTDLAPEPAIEIPVEAPAEEAADAPNGPRCVWPIGDPGSPDFHFCNRPAAPERPYCSAHCTIAYIRKDKIAAA
jgi:GcrA cell cycle regulator